MTLRQAERLLHFLDLKAIYDRETVLGEFKTDGRTLNWSKVAEARAEFLRACSPQGRDNWDNEVDGPTAILRAASLASSNAHRK